MLSTRDYIVNFVSSFYGVSKECVIMLGDIFLGVITSKQTLNIRN